MPLAVIPASKVTIAIVDNRIVMIFSVGGTLAGYAVRLRYAVRVNRPSQPDSIARDSSSYKYLLAHRVPGGRTPYKYSGMYRANDLSTSLASCRGESLPILNASLVRWNQMIARGEDVRSIQGINSQDGRLCRFGSNHCRRWRRSGSQIHCRRFALLGCDRSGGELGEIPGRECYGYRRHRRWAAAVLGKHGVPHSDTTDSPCVRLRNHQFAWQRAAYVRRFKDLQHSRCRA